MGTLDEIHAFLLALMKTQALVLQPLGGSATEAFLGDWLWD